MSFDHTQAPSPPPKYNTTSLQSKSVFHFCIVFLKSTESNLYCPNTQYQWSIYKGSHTGHTNVGFVSTHDTVTLSGLSRYRFCACCHNHPELMCASVLCLDNSFFIAISHFWLWHFFTPSSWKISEPWVEEYNINILFRVLKSSMINSWSPSTPWS